MLVTYSKAGNRKKKKKKKDGFEQVLGGEISRI